jgi:hypothetical protein
MNKEFVPYEESIALKELGFDEPCLGAYFHAGKRLYITAYVNHGQYTTLAPTFSQAFRWFRDKYKLHYSIDYECSQHDHKWGYNWTIYNYSQVVKTNEEYIQSNPIAPSGEWVHETHEEAEIACLKKLIELV